MIPFRYVIVVLCAMFLMLGIGIILGAATNFGPELSKRQTADIRGLSDKLDSMAQESDRDQELLHGSDNAIISLTPRLVSGKLSGKRFAIIQTGDYPAATQSASNAITAADGIVVSVTVVTNRLTEMDTTRLQQVVNQLTAPQPAGSSLTPVQELLRPLVNTCVVGTNNASATATDLAVLSSNDLIDESGDYTMPVTGVVVVGGMLDDQLAGAQSPGLSESDVEAGLLYDLSNYAEKLTVVGCEPFDAEKSSLTDFNTANIGSVDCIDLPLGALDLPFALRDNDQTAYGVKATASKQIPAELSDESAQSSPTPDIGTAKTASKP